MNHHDTSALPTHACTHPLTLPPGCRAHFWAESEKKMSGYLQDIARSVPEVTKAPQDAIIGDASESTFAFYWAAGTRAHRTFGKVGGSGHVRMALPGTLCFGGVRACMQHMRPPPPRVAVQPG